MLNDNWKEIILIEIDIHENNKKLETFITKLVNGKLKNTPRLDEIMYQIMLENKMLNNRRIKLKNCSYLKGKYSFKKH